MTNKEILYCAVELYRKEHEVRKETEAYNGGYGDGGYGFAMLLVKVFYDGIKFIEEECFPEFLKPYIQKVINRQDPEYNKYQELKKKFKEG